MEDLIAKYPKAKRKRQHPERRYRVRYDLAYEGGGSQWDGYYRSLVGASVAIFYNMNIASYGGSAKLYDRRVG